MKIKEGFMLRELAGQWVVVPIGNAVVDMNCIITLSSSGALLWKELEKGVEDSSALVDVLLNEYEVEHETAVQDCEDFIDQLNDKGMIA